MIHFPNFKKLFLLLFLLFPTAMWSMVEDRPRDIFCLVASGPNKKKSRILHRFLQDCLANVLDKNGSVYKDLQTMKTVYQKLGVTSVIHEDFTINEVGTYPGTLLEEKTQWPIESVGETEEIIIKLEKPKNVEEVKKCFAKLVFTPAVYTISELSQNNIKKQVKDLCDQYEELDVAESK